MELKVKNYFDNETLEHIGTRYFADNEEISFEDYSGLINDLFGDNEENTDSGEYNNQFETDESNNDCVCSLDGNCEKCDCSECDGCDNIECCNGNIENMDCEDEELENVCECECCQCPDNEDCEDFHCLCKDEDKGLCQCEECRKERFYYLLTDTLNHILEVEGCPSCTLETLLVFAIEFQDMGFRIEKS